MKAKYFLTAIFVLVLPFLAYTQNIVTNYSFDQADSCPTNFNNRTYKYSLGCIGWGQATQGTADYYNACDTAAASIGKSVPIMGVPHNTWGNQTAYEGVGYTGICVFDSLFHAYKEYLISNIPPLEVDIA